MAEQFNGVVVGIVTNNNDPENHGRVKVKFPWLSDELESDWFRVSSPMAGAGRGMMFMPEVDDEVLVAFEHGNPQRGFVVGSLWNGKDRTPMAVQDAVVGGKVRRRRIQSRTGHTIEMDDDDGMIHIQTPQGQVIELQDGQGLRMSTADGQQVYLSNNNGVALKTKSGKMIHASDSSGGVQIHDEAGNIVDIDTKSGTIYISAMTTINIKANAAVNVQSTGTLSITGTMVNINTGGAAPSGSKKGHSDPLGGKGSNKVTLPRQN